jgi:3-phenylpropionate/trans-cinnamate dioxygenase ferredoxin subunit
MEYVRVADASELAPGQMGRVQVDGHDILLANVEGNFYALGNRCPHRGGLLSDGSLVGGVVQCPKHGARFDLRTGRAVSGPTTWLFQRAVHDALPLQLLVDGTEIFVCLPEPE